MEYQLITNAPQSMRLESSPAGYWLIVQYEIVLKLSNTYALILTHPSYVLGENAIPRLGILCPPFIAFPVSSGVKYLDTVGSIRELYNHEESKIDFEKESGTFLYIMGLSNYKIKRVGELLEYKESNREQGKFKCYKLIRYAVMTENPRDLINLADPMVRVRHEFLPILKECPLMFTCKQTKRTHGISLTYRGMDLSSNLCRLLEDRNEVTGMLERALEIPPDYLYQEFDGFIIKYDVANSGRLSRYLLSQKPAYFISSDQIESTHQFILHSFFNETLIKCGISHYMLQGDGFIAGIPFASDNVANALARISELCQMLRNFIVEVNNWAGGDLTIDYRCVISETKYMYGRFNFCSNQCYFLGHPFITITRMDDGFKEAKQSGKTKPNAHIFTDLNTYKRHPDQFRGIFQLCNKKVQIVSKETILDGVALDLRDERE
jgi:hypothetical protein